MKEKSCKDCKYQYEFNGKCKYCMNYNCFEPKEKPISEIKLTESQFIEMDRYLYSNKDNDAGRDLRLTMAKKKGWIVKDEIEQAIEGFDNYVQKFRESHPDYFDNVPANKITDLSKDIIDLLQKRIKELEG